MRTIEQAVQLIRTILTEHEEYFDHLRPQLKRFKNSYENKFWEGQQVDDSMIRVETADCFSYIEGFIASLFSRSPAVAVGKDPSMTSGNASMAQEVVNRFLFEKREQIEIASRLALIYPNSFLKLSDAKSEDMLEKVAIKALPPWEVITDMDASSWDSQRFCGHVYYLTVAEAKQKFGNKKFSAIPKVDYFDTDNNAAYNGKINNLPEEYLYIQVVELYDFSYDHLYIWSPNYSDGDKLLEKSEIPLRTYDDKPLSPLCPIYFARKPERPMCGLSAVARVYDQFFEKNILRTYWANSIRRDSRQYLYKEGTLDPEALAAITAGIDGAMIPVDEQSLAGIIQPIGVESISTNFDRYLGQIEADINRGSILAPFSRGEATKATATEITALAQYSASEIGKLAREKDNSIELLARAYLRTVSLLCEEGETATIEIDDMPKIITVEDLDAKFKIVALDQSSTPLSDSIKKNNLIMLAPQLMQLGVPAEKIKEEIIRLYDLPKSFMDTPEAAPQAAGGLPQGAAGELPPEGDIGPAGELPAEQLSQMLMQRGGRA
jgi:cellobiose-specific phosphotransferase system component IIB